MTYHSNMKARTHLVSESLLEFSIAPEQLVHHTLVRLPQYFIQREVANSFISWIRDLEVKLSLLMGGRRTLDRALCQGLVLEAAQRPQQG
jgi:hypothetical protein